MTNWWNNRIELTKLGVKIIENTTRIISVFSISYDSNWKYTSFKYGDSETESG